MEKIDLEKVLEFPLTAVPLSLAHTDGSMNTTDKSKLMHKLEKMVSDECAPSILSTKPDVTIIDATFFLHTQTLKLFNDILTIALFVI